MKITRVNENKVECIISMEDLEENGLELEDLLTKNEDAAQFVRKVIEMAEEEVDYKPKNGMMVPVQIRVVDNECIAMTLNEDPSGAVYDFLQQLSEAMGMQLPKDVLEDLGDCPEDERIERINEYLKSKEPSGHMEIRPLKPDRMTRIGKSVSRPRRVSNNAEEPDGFLFAFPEMADAISYAHSFGGRITVSSSMYKDRKTNVYYLYVQKGRTSAKRFAGLLAKASEFGFFCTAKSANLAFIKENFEPIIATNAIGVLRKLR